MKRRVALGVLYIQIGVVGRQGDHATEIVPERVTMQRGSARFVHRVDKLVGFRTHFEVGTEALENAFFVKFYRKIHMYQKTNHFICS